MKKKKWIRNVMIISLIIIILCTLYFFNYIPHRKYTNADFGISDYISSVDQDQDGIDDQTDILNSVREYLKTNPKYKSKYYSTGYPDDEYGTCVDVVGFGLLGAGYDLMELVNADIINHPDQYQIETIDKNIDFRRVKNLNVYFSNHAISLTTDIYDIDAWQGGDIIVFKNHIGIISDKRNRKGIPFVLHHGGSFQMSYEEDILEERNDIMAHYRIS